MNKFLIIITLFLTIASSAFSNPTIQARTGILVDYHSDEILFELDPDSQIYPASMTKIMTAIVAFDLIKKINCHWMITLLYLRMLGDYPKLAIHLCLL